MNKLILIALLSVGAQGSEAPECKRIFDDAVKAMTIRQNSNDVFSDIKEYPELKILILDAYDYPRYDTTKSLSEVVDLFGERGYQAAKIRHNQVEEARGNVINEFKNKHIKKCLKGA